MGLSLSAFARLVAVSHQAVSKRVRNGSLSTEPDGTIDQQRGLREWYENVHPGAQPGATNGSSGYATARTAREALTARILELDYRQRAGELVEVTEVRDAAFKAGRAVHDALGPLPDRLVGVLWGVKTRAEMHRLLTGEFAQVLDKLAATQAEPMQRRRRRSA